jgi:regulator of replication initiation timing
LTTKEKNPHAEEDLYIAERDLKDAQDEIKRMATGLQNLANERDALKAENEELKESLKKSSFVSAKDIDPNAAKMHEILMHNAKLRILLGVKSVEVRVTETGDYVIFSDPQGKKLELRKKHVDSD